MAETFRPPWAQFEAASGVPLAGAKLYFYQATTTTPITVYQDNALGTPHANPVVADAAGMFAPIFIDTVTNPTYKVVLNTSADVLVQTIDNVQTDASGATASFDDDEFEIVDNVDDTKVLKFQASGITSGQTRTLTAPDASGTIALQSYVDDEIEDARPRRNRLVNPAMQISSVNGNTSGTTNGYVPADNWAVNRVTSAGTITTQRVQSVTPKGAKDRIRVTITVADASLAAGEYLTVTQAIVGQEIADFQYGSASAKQTVLRFLFKGPAGTYAVALHNAANDRSYVALFTPASANTDEVISVIIPGDTTGTWTTASTTGLTLDIVLACGSTFQGTTGWQAGNILGTSGVTNGMGTVASVFEVGEAGLYLDPDSTGVAPAWELPSYNEDKVVGTYTEGTWTPAITFGGASVGITYTVQTGTYTKIGRFVFLSGQITLSSKGSSVGNTQITGLPFTSGAPASMIIGNYASMSSVSAGITGLVAAAATVATLYTPGASTVAILQDTNFTNTSDLRFSLAYIV